MDTHFSGMRFTLPGPRITLRIMEDADASERYASWLNDPEVNRYLGTKHATVEELRAYIAEKDRADNALFFGIFLRDGTLIGTIKLEPIDLAAKQATIAVMVGDKAQWGKGFGNEAMQLLIEWCFSTLGLEEIILGVVGTHFPAIRSYEKLGFREFTRDIDALHYGDEIHDRVWMHLCRPSQAQDDKKGNTM